MDVLTDVLNTLELKGWLSSRRELTPPWRYDFAASKDSMFMSLALVEHTCTSKEKPGQYGLGTETLCCSLLVTRTRSTTIPRRP
jgi:hypothetical protein